MTSDEASEFASRWIEDWNHGDVERQLAHFAEGVRFTSPRALATTGSATLRGKKALRAYWTAALSQIKSLNFELDHIAWDSKRNELIIVYISQVDGQRNRACELLQFDSDGQVIAGEAMYGAQI